MQFTIKRHAEINKETWNLFILNNSMGWAYHLYEIIGVEWSDGNINESFAIEDAKGCIVFLMQLNAVRITYKTWNEKLKKYIKVLLKRPNIDHYLVSRWGYVLADNISKKQAKRIKELAHDYIKERATFYHCGITAFCLPPLAEGLSPNKCPLVNPVVHLGISPNVRYTWMVDLSKDEEALFRDCQETTRQAIRKLKAQDRYSINEACGSEEDIRTYCRLHNQTYTRTNHQDAILSENYHRWMFSLIGKGYCRIFFLRDNDIKKTLAAVAILQFKKTAYYWWGCSVDNKETGLHKYLLFCAIKAIRTAFQGEGFFETGSAWPHLTHGKDKGLSDFKKSFGCFLHPIYGGYMPPR